MSRQPTITDIRLNNTIACLTPTLALLDELSDTFGTPFVPAISNTTLSLISAVQNVKRNKDDCIQLLENVYQLLCAIINLHIKSEIKGSLDPTALDHVGKFTETLHKIHTFVEAQQDRSKIMHFFRQTETKTLLGECRAGLLQAFEVFKTEIGISGLGHVTQMRQEMDMMHIEMLELISSLSDGTTSDSLNSISMLPAKPKIFHGRESELQEVVKLLQQEAPRIAILGAGGMGKTSLAKATLHHPEITAKYQQCFFVVADSVTTSVELSGLIGEYIGLKPAKDATKQVIQYFATTGPVLLILDNLETSWEPIKSRGEITMRGAERPAKVQWTHPFLATLKPLSYLAARATFLDIAEDVHDSKDVDEVLSLTDNMPLAVDLIAHAVEFEGSCSTVLARWKTEKTSLLSAGNDRKSNMDTSIAISLSSSRMSTGAKDLLSLLSILPDGLSDVELVKSKLSIQNIMTCRATLLATSLAYIDEKRRLKSLVPIREHMQFFCPPSPLLIHALQKYFHQFLDLYQRYPRTQQRAGTLMHLALNLRNMRELVLRGLHQDNPNLAETIDCTLSMKLFMQQINAGYFHLMAMLMDHIEAVLPDNCPERFKVELIMWKFESRSQHLSIHADLLIIQAVSHFHMFNDPALESSFYLQVGHYYFHVEKKLSVALEYLHKAHDLAKKCGDIRQEARILNIVARIRWCTGDYPAGQFHAQASHRLSETSGDLHSQSAALRTSALCYRSCGDTKKSILVCQRAQKLLELCGITTGSSYTNLLQDLAEAHLVRSEYAEARNIHTQIARDTVTEDPYQHAWALMNIVQVDLMMGSNKQDVLPILDKAKVLFNALSHGYYDLVSAKMYCNIGLGQLHLREGEILTAKYILQTSFDLTLGNDTQGALWCLQNLANVNDWPESDFYWASRWTVIYLGYAKKLENKVALRQALQFLGDVFQAESDSETATALFTVALDGFTTLDIHRSRAECLLRLGDLANGQGDVSKATELWKLARPLFERSSQAKQVAQIDERLHKDMQGGHTESLAYLLESNVPTRPVAEKIHKETKASDKDKVAVGIPETLHTWGK
ncbi:hypothetical protein FB451DRAFT_1163820 [Mycena latifolia]|nr:hypothetical protein FB451DRAFT_1163820 [Mycena latifolia]